MRSDRGSATVWLAGFTALVALATTAALLPGSAVLARHRVAAAADLAALAGAVQVLDGAPAVCATARDIAARNGGSLTRCAVSGDDVEVDVTRPLVLGGLGSWTATARARAGPVDRNGPRT
ncbi:MAG TPA: Rv3654c family TadE-like protein [Mycobacteriales bacterium]|nr:Rv3654c family TadE-like protein [Mycobacteriales bacterium]